MGVVKKFYVNKTMQYERHGAALRRSAVAGYRWPRLSTMGRNDEASRTHERLAVGRFRPGEPGGERAAGVRRSVDSPAENPGCWRAAGVRRSVDCCPAVTQGSERPASVCASTTTLPAALR